MADNTNPWADTANQAVGALYKHYLSQPNQAEIQQNELKNQLLQAQYGTELSRQKKLGFEADGLEMRNAAPSKMSDLLGSYFQSNQPKVRPELLDAVIQQESGGDPMALSPVGASGIMQIMPDTARDPGYGVQPLQGWDGEDPRSASVEEQIRFGQDYLAAMIKQNGGDESLGLAAYNAGPGAVEEYGGIPPYEETQNYVQKITGNAPAPTGGISEAYAQYMPNFLEQAMSAAIENPAQAADVLQMIGGAAQFQPDILANIQSGAGTDYGKTQAGFNQEMENPDLMNVSAGATVFDPVTRQPLYTNPKQGGSGSSITMPDGTIIDIDGGAGVQTSIGRSANNKVQDQQIEGAKFNRMVDYTRKLSSDPSNFGVMGYAKGKLQDTAMLLNGVSQTLGYDAPEQAFNDIVKKESGNPELSESFLTELYDPQLNALQKAANLMVYQAASSLASQSGRSVSDRDVTFFKNIVGDPQSFFMNQQKFMSGLDVMQDILANQQGVLQDASGGDVVGEQYEAPDPTQFQKKQAPAQGVVTISGDDEYEQLAPGTKFIAPDGTTRIKQ